MGRDPSIDKRAAQFVRAHLGREAFAECTGTDTSAWHAWLDLVELYGRNPTHRVVAAMQAVVLLAQPKEPVLRCFVQSIPALLDWGHVAKIWPRVCDGTPMASLPPDAMRYTAVERASAKGPIIRQWGQGAYGDGRWPA